MAYQLGIDLGTTWTAAAVCRDGQERPELLHLGGASSAVATVVFRAADGGLVLGEAAQRRALTEPRRVAREFKRRIGDDTPMVVGGEPMTAAELCARFVAWVVDEAARREGSPAESIAVTHPVEWGEHKRATFADALAAVGLGHAAFLTEPQAAAVGYASTERIEPGGIVGVYDLGGGTFDAAVVRKLADGGFALLGSPTGIERLGGVDFDDAILAHVRTALGPAWGELDAADASVQAAVAGLRRECTAAKEALSADTEVLVPVMLPGTHTQVRLGRAEFEDMIRPSVGETVEALRRAVDSAGLTPADLDAVLLVGGSSRIPLVSQLVSAELGRSISVDADPKGVVAAGAALTARSLVAPAVPPADLPADPLDELPAVPPVAFDAPSDEDAAPPRRRRAGTLVVAASIAVVATFGLSATLATGVVPLPAAVFGDAAAGDAGGAVAQAETVLADAPAVDPWTGAAPAETTVPGPRRPEAVAAAVRPVARVTPTGAAGASRTVPTPAAAVPAAPVAPTPAPAPVVPAPGAGTEGGAAGGDTGGAGGGSTGGGDTGSDTGGSTGGDTGGTGGGDTGGSTGGGDTGGTTDPGTGGGDTGGGDTGGTEGGGTEGGATGGAPAEPGTPSGGSEAVAAGPTSVAPSSAPAAP
ncbi:Hsp70 family protein [Pseudonocardia petroleophila]|uniref:Hsp70 family protein n=1 Tax=Pseudonocardia petroleophila TaxID=37331 RepID=A0A7G7MNT7_9PSEU|nr:Hsp70 family protein [Pseudonocardia petroleophila]QNG54448.1 Hsp70 family protein [Pseudonocardia petroleophila]